MNAIEAIRKRRTVHSYSPTNISDEVIEEALELAILAPNHRFTFPWRFVVAGAETRRAITELAVQLAAEKRQGEVVDRGALYEKFARKFEYPGVLVAFCQVLSDNPEQSEEDYASVSCGIENFCIAMAAHGYGSKWSTGSITRNPRTYQLLGIDPKVDRIVGFVMAGHANGELPEQRRPELLQLARFLP